MKLTLILVFLFLGLQQKIPWNSPKEADNIQNPLKSDPVNIKAGNDLYTKYCLMCHGAKGKGDGPAGVSLVPHPGNLLSSRIAQSTDGSLYWKIKQGKAPMPAYVITDTQRWSLVNYIRELQKVNGISK
ncbi:MAG: cytochrome c [Bacteroidetes bacterium]|nr:cytochrome c [Bacteroidota bacterium]